MYEQLIEELRLIIQRNEQKYEKPISFDYSIGSGGGMGFIAQTLSEADSAKLIAEELERIMAENAKKGETFSSKVLAYVDKTGISDVEFYNSAKLTKSVWSDLRKPTYKPSKQTAVKIAVTLNLSYSEAEELLNYAGYSFKTKDEFNCIGSLFGLKDEHSDVTLSIETTASILEQCGKKSPLE